MEASLMVGQVVDKLVLAGIAALVMWPLKIFKRKVDTFTTQLSDVHKELIVQRTNCLATLQKNSDEMINQQKETNETLADTKDVLVEMKGYLEGMSR